MKWLLVPAIIVMGCVTPELKSEIDQLQRRTELLTELHRARDLTPERCASFSGPDVLCGKVKPEDTGCTCQFADNTGARVAEPSPTPSPNPEPVE